MGLCLELLGFQVTDCLADFARGPLVREDLQRRPVDELYVADQILSFWHQSSFNSVFHLASTTHNFRNNKFASYNETMGNVEAVNSHVHPFASCSSL